MNSQDIKPRILKSEIIGYEEGNKSSSPYRMKLYKKEGLWKLRPERAFLDEGKLEYIFTLKSKGVSLPSYNLKALISGINRKAPVNKLYIDRRQNQYIMGCKLAIIEAHGIAKKVEVLLRIKKAARCLAKVLNLSEQNALELTKLVVRSLKSGKKDLNGIIKGIRTKGSEIECILSILGLLLVFDAVKKENTGLYSICDFDL